MDTPRFLYDMYLGFGCILCNGEFVYCVWVRVPSASFPWPFFLCEAVPLIYCHLHPSSNYLDNGVIEFWCETQQNQDSYGNLVFSRTLGKLTEENIKFNGVTGSSFSFVFSDFVIVYMEYWLRMGIKLGMTWRVALFLMCLIEISISTIDVRRYCLEIMSIWQYEGLVCHGQIPLFSLSSCVPGRF